MIGPFPGWGGPGAHIGIAVLGVAAVIVAAIAALFLLVALVAFLFVLVRFLVVGARAAELYIAERTASGAQPTPDPEPEAARPTARARGPKPPAAS